MQTVLLPPISDLGPNNYQPQPSGPHFANVDENPHDGEATHLRMVTGGNESFGVDVSAIPDGSAILAVRIQMAVRGTNTGPSSSRGGFNLAGLDYFGPVHEEAEDQGYHVYVDDLTAIAAWTKELLAAAILRHQSVSMPVDLPRPRLSQLVVFADIVPPADRPHGASSGQAPRAGTGSQSPGASGSGRAPRTTVAAQAPLAGGRGQASRTSAESQAPGAAVSSRAPRAVTPADLPTLRATIAAQGPRASISGGSPQATISPKAPKGEGS